jgi:hypothetical protein
MCQAKYCVFDNKSNYHSKVAVTERVICLCVRVLNFYDLKSKYLVEKNKQKRTAWYTHSMYLSNVLLVT